MVDRACPAQRARPRGYTPQELDGFSVSSFTLFPDTPVGLTQHLGLTLRYLDSIPMGGASGVVAARRAARAVQAGDADVVACVAGDANQIDSFRRLLSSFSRFSMDAAYPYGYGGPERQLRPADRCLHGRIRRDARGFWPHCCCAARQCVAQSGRADEEAADYGSVPLCASDFQSDSPVRLRHALRRRGSLPGDARGGGHTPRTGLLPASTARSERHNAFPDDPIQLRGGWAMDVDELYDMAGLRARAISISCRPMTTIR